MKKALLLTAMAFICSLAFSQISLSESHTNVMCNGASNGSATVTPTGGNPAYTYTLTAPFQTNGTGVFSGLVAGTYSVIVEDISAATSSITFTITEPSQIIPTVSSNPVVCFGTSTGTINVTGISGGVPPYQYELNAGAYQTSSIFANVPTGIYSVGVKDANGCIGTNTVAVTQPTQLVASITSFTNVICNGQCNGAFNSTAAGGTAPYVFSTSFGSTVPNNQNVCAGTHSLTVQDANNCVATVTVTLTEPPALTYTLTTANPTCNGVCNGTASVAYSGGAGIPTFLWQPGLQASNSVNTLCAGAQTVTVTYNGICSTSIAFMITDPALLTAAITATNSNCGQSTGALCASVTGGVGVVSYLWSNNNTAPCNNLIPAGAYSLTVTDQNGCVANASGLVNDIGGPMPVITSFSNVTCFGLNNGGANVNVTGGTAPYTYTWTGGAPTNTSSVSNLGVGMYGVSVTDATGCIGTATVFISQPPPINITTNTSNALCGLNNGSIIAYPSGGVPPYMYTWMPAGGMTTTLQNLSAGNYTLQVTDSYGCVGTVTTTVLSIGSGSLSNVTTSLTPTKETCSGFYDGSMDLTLSGSNTGPFTYQWSNGATTQDIFNVPANYYSVIIFDAGMNCAVVGDTVKMDGTTCGSISGKVFIDNNSDCVFNTGDNGYSYVMITANPGNILGYTNYLGNYSLSNVPFGTYTITANLNNPNLMATCTTSIISTISGGSPSSMNNDFAREYIPVTQPDLSVGAYCNGIVPGFVCTVNYYLNGNNTFSASGIYKVTLPSAFIPNITQASPATYTLSGDTILWNFNNVSNASSANFYVKFTTPLTTPLGSIFTSCIWAQPTVTDLNYANNNYCYSRTVNGSFDPNDKAVSPVGQGVNGDIPFIITDLTYLIRFQNTGNGPAVNIVVKDTISPNVDISTFEMISASHNYNIDILPGNVIRWKFNNIMLADSGSNEPASHGYIQYKIKRAPVYQPGTQIKNTAYIYFDFNAPVVTNTAINTIEYITNVQSQNAISDQWLVYPNPSTGVLNLINNNINSDTKLKIEVVNSFGQIVLEDTATANHKTLDMSDFANGVYFVKIVSEKNTSVKRVVLNK